MRAVGKGIKRPDAYDKVLGKAVYPDDIEFPGMLYAGVKRSEVAYGRVIDINIEEIRNIPGVVCVIDYPMIPGEKKHGVVFKDMPILVQDIVKRVGDPIILVVAESKSSLKEALNKVKIIYEIYEGIFNVFDALQEDAPIIGDGSNILYDLKLKTGDIEQGFREAAHIVEDWYETQMVEHAFLQPEACVANYDDEGVLNIYVATQYPHYDLEEVIRCLNLLEKDVRIINTAIGGAFGAREDINPQCHAALAAYYTKKPVKIVYTREESTISHSKRHPLKMHYKIGATKAGKLCALQARIYGDTGAYASWGINVMRKSTVHATGPYIIPHVDIKTLAIYTNNPYCGAMRGFGATQVPFAMESLMDRLAEILNMHPLQFRYINAFTVGSKTATGQVLESSVGLKKCLETLAELDGVKLEEVHS